MDKSETKQCQNCKKEFTIEPEDFLFYEKIKVPAPTWCPECRMIRRMFFRNERSLYRRKCDAPGHNEEIISIYFPDKQLKVYDQKYWWSDEWDPMEYGRDYDFSKPFFEQFRKLLEEVPNVAVFNRNPVNSEYCNHAANNKNCYCCFGSWNNEDCLYLDRTGETKDSLDILWSVKLERCYQSADLTNCYQTFFSQRSTECANSILLYDCRNCPNCFGCINLRNKQYHIFNKPYSKEEYFNKIKEFNLGSYKNLLKQINSFNDLKIENIHRFANIVKCYKSSGDNLRNTKNCLECFNLQESENCKFAIHGGFVFKDTYDGFGVGINSDLGYEIIDTGYSTSRTYFTIVVWGSHNIYYSYNCHSSSNLFGCVSLRNKQYCIFNKQYTKEEYEKLVPKIIEHMNSMPYIDKKGRIYKYGEFFPPELSPFCYNETIAQEYFPLTKEQALEQGYSWKDPVKRDLQPTTNNQQLPDNIKDVPDSIVDEIIECAHKGECNEQCTEVFKIIEPELEFYRKMNLPLPRLCPNCRHYQRIKQRNPLKLWHCRCQCNGEKSSNGVYQNTIVHFHGNEPCPNEFETTYAPDRPEIVYCEKCYQQEVV